jgi:ankyrin repeat protein
MESRSLRSTSDRKTVEQDMTEEQMLPEFKRVLQGKDSYGNTVMHYFALRKNDEAIAELLRVGGCMCIHNHAGQSAIDVRKTGELRMFDANIPLALWRWLSSSHPQLPRYALRRWTLLRRRISVRNVFRELL